MAVALIGNLAAGVANAAANTAVAEPITAEAIYWPAWILVGGVLLALLAIIGVLSSIKATLLAKPKKRDAEFIHMLCKQVWKHTDDIKGVFHQRLRQPPGDVVTLRVLVRLLREDLAAPMNFVEQMRSHPPATWPDYELFAAFNNWGGKVSAIESQLKDLQHMLSYPVVREPVDPHREAMLLHHFATEQAPLGYAIGQVVSHAIAVCERGKTALEAEKASSFSFGLGGEHDKHEDEGGCAACKRDTPHTPFAMDDTRFVMMIPPPVPPKKDKEKDKDDRHGAQLCYCTVPQPCHCVPATCACACSCKSGAPRDKHAH
jgi:hypothetical protein